MKKLFILLVFIVGLVPVGFAQEANLYQECVNLINAGKFDEGLTVADKMIRENRSDARAYLLRGYCYSMKKMYREAVRDYTDALSHTAPFDELYVNRADAYLGMGMPDLALADCSAALALNNKCASAYMVKGSCFSEKGMYDEALEQFTQSIRYDKNNPNGYYQRGFTYLIKSYFDKTFAANAIKDFSQSIKLNPKFGSGYQGRGNVHAFMGNYKQGIVDLEQAVRVSPNEPSGYLDLMTALVRAGDINKARQYLELFEIKNLSIAPHTNAWAFYDHYIKALFEGVLRGSYEKASKEISLAERQYFDALKTHRSKYDMKLGFMDVTFLKGYVLEQIGKLDEAKIAYEQALLLNSNWTDLAGIIKRLEGKSEVEVATDKQAPEIRILEPNITRSFEIVSGTNQRIIGKAVDKSGISSVTINGLPVKDLQDDGTFIHEMSYAQGKNNITVAATDKGGNTSSRSFVINGNKTGDTKNIKEASAIVAKKITNHAIIIAQQEYKDPAIPTLQFPIKDANEFKQILQTHYTFDADNILVLENAARDEVLEAIMAKCRSLTDDDNLLIFYAGHGIAVKGEHNDVYPYWIPVTAKKDKYSTYINVQEVRTATKNSHARHILIIADACFAGALSRGLQADAPLGLARRYELVSRKVMTSGNLEAVPDNSKFMLYLKKALLNNKQKYLSAFEIFSAIAIPVGNFEATPQYAPMPNTGDSGGDFVFIRR
jgi:tetratricopeptide (TPR) repeat protein